MSSLPEAPFAHIASVMSTFHRPWFLCGGWAVDAWLGRQTRVHGDVDIGLFADDQATLFDRLAGWHMVAHDESRPTNTDPWDGRPLGLPAHIHARPPGEVNQELLRRWVTPPHTQALDGLDYEFVINRRSGDDWLLESPRLKPGSRGQLEPLIPLPLDQAVRDSPAGLPAAVPEVIMFFKATAYRDSDKYPRPHDESDFRALLPLATRGGREWLTQSITTLVAAHPWLPLLE